MRAKWDMSDRYRCTYITSRGVQVTRRRCRCGCSWAPVGGILDRVRFSIKDTWRNFSTANLASRLEESWERNLPIPWIWQIQIRRRRHRWWWWRWQWWRQFRWRQMIIQTFVVFSVFVIFILSKVTEEGEPPILPILISSFFISSSGMSNTWWRINGTQGGGEMPSCRG